MGSSDVATRRGAMAQFRVGLMKPHQRLEIKITFADGLIAGIDKPRLDIIVFSLA